MRTNKRIRTVLYGDQRLSAAELEVIHTPAMQRLYGLKQLGLTDRVFIDASHARIHHVVGVIKQADHLVSAIKHNLGNSDRELRIGSAKGNSKAYPARHLAVFVESRRSVVRFIGLLHDLTHAPFGHTIEDEIRLVRSKHDEPERQADAFYRLLCQLVAWLCLESHGPEWTAFPESLKPFLSQGAAARLPEASEVGRVARELICGLSAAKASQCLRLTPKHMAEMFAHLACAMTALLHLQVLHEPNPTRADVPEVHEYKFQELVRVALEETRFESLNREFKFDPQREAFMLDIVGNTVCADLLDYARRDSHFAGLRLDYDSDRIAENFTLVAVDSSAYDLNHRQGSEGGVKGAEHGADAIPNPFDGWCLRTAISLVSHKFRIDVPSELMNLLNVRFYLYERVIFHPTKCAAGSMLGTALQLLGWRETKSGDRPSLPNHLRFVGDDVFIHDISCALDFVEHIISTLPEKTQIEAEHVERIEGMDGVHSGLAATILGLRMGQNAVGALSELRAARLLLNRLMSRRYLRPVFRALPSTKDATLQAGPEALAKLFRQPDLRYKAEREIEQMARLPLGTVTIHCPTRTTARKIANVYLTKPDIHGNDEVCKLKDIATLDKEIFGEHERAVKAVELMYGSMWRLTVYVASEHLENWAEISNAAGEVIFATVDVHEHFPDRSGRRWENDPNLVRELEGKMHASFGDSGGAADYTPLADILGRIGDELVRSERLRSISSDLYSPDEGLSEEGRKRLEDAVVAALSKEGGKVEQSPRDRSLPRTNQVITIIRGYVKRINKDELSTFHRAYTPRLDELSVEEFEKTASGLETAVFESIRLDENAAVHKGYKFNQCLELLDELIKRSAGGRGGLFGDRAK